MTRGRSSRSNGGAIELESSGDGQREGQSRLQQRGHPAIGNRAAEVEAVVAGDCRDPFGFLGMHLDGPGDCVTVRVFYPAATRLELLHAHGALSELERIHPPRFLATAL